MHRGWGQCRKPSPKGHCWPAHALLLRSLHVREKKGVGSAAPAATDQRVSPNGPLRASATRSRPSPGCRARSPRSRGGGTPAPAGHAGLRGASAGVCRGSNRARKEGGGGGGRGAQRGKGQLRPRRVRYDPQRRQGPAHAPVWNRAVGQLDDGRRLPQMTMRTRRPSISSSHCAPPSTMP